MKKNVKSRAKRKIAAKAESAAAGQEYKRRETAPEPAKVAANAVPQSPRFTFDHIFQSDPSTLQSVIFKHPDALSYNPVSVGNPEWKLIDWDPIQFSNQSLLQGVSQITVIDPIAKTKSKDLECQINELRKSRDAQAVALQAEKEGSRKQASTIKQLKATVMNLQEKERLRFLLERVSGAAHEALLVKTELRNQFMTTEEVPAFVMSVDIRRSTELMLKARKPEQFAAFITTLCTDLMRIIYDCLGVVDKFTGDGVLSFFPEFFTGPDAGYLVATAAARCHEAFDHHYRAFRSSFNSVLSGVGLGIGIDYGMLHLVQMAGGLTVVGQPVVYACRLGGCPAGTTLLNQPAYEKIMERFSSHLFVQETELEIKHEGKILAYTVSPNRNAYKPTMPDWLGAASGPEE